MLVTRREALSLGRGVAATAVLAGLGLMRSPREAKAIIGVDDALLGAVVVAIASLGGYALYNQYVGNNSLQAVGASFSDYVSITGNREAAIQAAMAAAAIHGIAGTQPDFERAGNLIASGEGAFLSAMQSAASSGRLALDGLVSGSDALVGMMRELVTGWIGSGLVTDTPMTVPDSTLFGTGTTTTLPVPIGVMMIDNMLAMFSNNPTLPIQTTEAWLCYDTTYESTVNNTYVGAMYIGNDIADSLTYNETSHVLSVRKKPGTPGRFAQIQHNISFGVHSLRLGGWSSTGDSNSVTFDGHTRVIMTPGVIGGPLLPGVDRAADAPDVIGTSWDSLPIATDMVISPTTGDIVSAGSIALPTGIPTTAGDYAAALQGALAGVIADTLALPVGLEVPVTVATPTGIATMPISEAVATETSLQLDYAPSIPVDPVLPPVEVPEGPWTPAVELPFMNVWPFNMIYTFVETLGRLGN